MAVEPGYPVTLVHPQHSPAKIAQGREPAVPERFPAVMVNGLDSENQYRALGYLRYGEPQVMTGRYEYPKMLRHPDYEEEIPERTEATYENGRIVGTFKVPGVPAKMPHVFVNNKEEEDLWRTKGYAPSREYNQAEIDAALSGVPDEAETIAAAGPTYPRWENGVIVTRDPNEAPELEPDPSYPRYEDSVIVPDPRFPEEPDPTVYPMWVHRDGIPGEDSILVKNRAEELEAKRKHTEAETLWSTEDAEDTQSAIVAEAIKPQAHRRVRV